MAPNKGSIIKPAGKARSAAEFVTILRGRPTRTDLTQLADHLDPAKPMHVAGFLASFIEAQVRTASVGWCLVAIVFYRYYLALHHQIPLSPIAHSTHSSVRASLLC